jgi:Tfp pilus assembly protein PilV
MEGYNLNVFDHRNGIDKSNISGFTLLEVVIGIVLFVAVALPLTAWFYSNNGTIHSQESLIAVWLLEQESAHIKMFPEEVGSVRVRVVDGKEWKIMINKEGNQLVQYTLSAATNGKKMGEVVVYGLSGK